MGSTTPTTSSTPPLAFREATPADVPLLLPLIRTAYRTPAGWTNEAAYLNDKRISPADLAAKISRPDGVVLMATNPDSAALVACCEVQIQHPDPSASSAAAAAGPTAYFGLFAVDPALQGGGVGRRVLARAEEYARETWRARRMVMWVIWLRTELIDWYLRRGYVRTGETAPFPYDQMFQGKALRDDLYFDVLRKEFGESEATTSS
ncbi:alpha/beta hydrolase [Sodiomyces alkalinus F11]|uniref:Alpha/beta hydrolase n=1 Tax=Sodiomyces alkalinus (strain CBS 110278 / VKM F-3762 / F11) TaxID=1314773 RepID=A0A3N2PTL0_SODAK|nr:alpha/beta hydrolase [Sodiomyces alkalinus F11]ROT37845.1 alpha/beta hydrolase [Sodiomyces alkalinus F11]